MDSPAYHMGFASFVPNAVPFYEMRPLRPIGKQKLVRAKVVKKSRRKHL